MEMKGFVKAHASNLIPHNSRQKLTNMLLFVLSLRLSLRQMMNDEL